MNHTRRWHLRMPLWQAVFSLLLLFAGGIGWGYGCAAKTKVTGVDASRVSPQTTTAESKTDIEAPIVAGGDASQKTFAIGSIAINGGGGLVAGIVIAILALVARWRRLAVDRLVVAIEEGARPDTVISPKECVRRSGPDWLGCFIARRVRKLTK